MTFCLAVTVLFLWVWHHQTQFNDHYRKATFLMRNGEADQAIEAYQKAIKNKTRTIFFVKEPSVYNNLGQAYLYAEAYAEAVANFKKTIEMAPDMVEGYVNLTTAYLRQNYLPMRVLHAYMPSKLSLRRHCSTTTLRVLMRWRVSPKRQ